MMGYRRRGEYNDQMGEDYTGIRKVGGQGAGITPLCMGLRENMGNHEPRDA
jgi:hypothetical protein